jgi:hypothetical protein
MRGRWVARLMAIMVFLFIAAPAFAAGVFFLWNWLAPTIFGLHTITFWQALGLLWLCWILFAGPQGWPGRRADWRGRMMERWEQMTPEEREKFREGMRHRCGQRGVPEPKTTA